MITAFAYHPGVRGAAHSERLAPEDVAGFAAAREVCRREAGGYFFAARFMPRPKQDAACAVYAFCRMVAEAVDVPAESLEGAAGLRHHPVAAQGCTSCGPTGSADGRVALLRERLDEIYDGRLELPLPDARSEAQHALHAFAATVRRYAVPRQHFLELAKAYQADGSVSRYATWASLERHCYGVAGIVGVILCGVLGVTNSGAAEYAAKLGVAMRLTNILRDLKDDAGRGRVYLPLEDLARFRYSERDLAAGLVNESFRQLMRFEIVRARRLYEEGAAGLCWLADDGSRFAVSAILALHCGVLDAIERQGYDVLTRRPTLTKGQRLRRLATAWRMARQRPRRPVAEASV
jgi:15-cis-phytoene synthase